MAASISSFPSVAEFYRGRNIFLTGGTGFIGKVFIEKMLRCCPDIGDVYVLIRPRRSQSVSERLKKMFKEKVSRRLAATLNLLAVVAESEASDYYQHYVFICFIFCLNRLQCFDNAAPVLWSAAAISLQ